MGVTMQTEVGKIGDGFGRSGRRQLACANEAAEGPKRGLQKQSQATALDP